MLLKSKICNLQSKILDNVLINFRFKISDQKFEIIKGKEKEYVY